MAVAQYGLSTAVAVAQMMGLIRQTGGMETMFDYRDNWVMDIQETVDDFMRQHRRMMTTGQPIDPKIIFKKKDGGSARPEHGRRWSLRTA